MKKVLSFFLVSLFSLQFVFSQSKTVNKNSAGFGTGYSFYYIKDELISPVTYSGFAIPYYLIYRYQDSENQHNFRIQFEITKLIPVKPVEIIIDSNSPDLQTGRFSSDFFRIHFDYTYYRLFKIMLKKRCKIFGGGNWSNFYQSRKLIYISPHYHDYEKFISSVSPVLQVNLEITKNNLIRYNCAISVTAFTLHLPNIGNRPGDKTFNIFNNFSCFNSRILYEYCLPRYFNIRVAYQFIYYKYTVPYKTRTVIDDFFLELVYKL